MPVMGKSKEEVLAEFRATEILEAARRVFAEKGFHDATIDDVAESGSGRYGGRENPSLHRLEGQLL